MRVRDQIGVWCLPATRMPHANYPEAFSEISARLFLLMHAKCKCSGQLMAYNYANITL